MVCFRRPNFCWRVEAAPGGSLKSYLSHKPLEPEIPKPQDFSDRASHSDSGLEDHGAAGNPKPKSLKP